MNSIYDWSIGYLVLAILVLSIVATELGYRIGRHQKRQESDRAYQMTSTLKASTLGLVALLLGFSFAITSSRFADRTRLVIDEANAITTCYARAGLVADPAGTRMRAMLRRYTELRLDLFYGVFDRARIERTLQQMDAAMDTLWSATADAVHADAELADHTQLIPAVNRVVELAITLRWAARSHLPAAVILLVSLCMAISGALVGHSSAQTGERHAGLWIALNLLIMLVVFLILDFDRPKRGFIKVDHQALSEVLQHMNR